MPKKKKGASKKSNAGSKARPKAMAASKAAAPPPPPDPDLTEMVQHLNELKTLCLSLHLRLHGQAGVKTTDHVLDDATSWTFAADVCAVLATNTMNVRDAIRVHDNIGDPMWGDPAQVVGGTETSYRFNILKWTRLESQMFTAMMSFYGIQLPPVSGHAAIHDALYELSVNGEDFIRSENAGEYRGAIGVAPTPAPPPNLSSVEPILASLQRLEFAMHRLVQYHMQIASFIPAHLPKMYVTDKGYRAFMK